MTPFGSLRLLASIGTAICASALLAGCGGGGSPPATEATPSRTAAFIASSGTASPAQELPGYLSPQVLGLTKIAERRVSRTVFDYDFVVQLKNGPRALSNVQAVIAGSGAGTTVLAATANVGEVAADATVTSTGIVTIRHDRTVPFSPAEIAWSFMGVVTASRDPIVVRRADPAMIRTLSDGQKVVMSQLLAVTDGTQTLEQDLAMFARLGAEVIGRVPEGNLFQLSVPGAVDEGSLVAERERFSAESRIVAVSYNGISDSTSDSGSYLPNDAFIATQTDALLPANVTVAWKTIHDNFSYFQNENGKQRLQKITVGIVDAGYVDTLRELQFTKLWGPEGGEDWGLDVDLKDDGERTHGMHVAGIIAAIGNNGSDTSNNTSQIAGIAWQSKPIVNAAKADKSLAVTLAHISRLARSGARVINISIGIYDRGDYTSYARIEASLLRNLFTYYDFLLVLSAGNDFDQAIWHQPLANIFQSNGWENFEQVKSRVLIVANADTSRPEARLAMANWNDSAWIDPANEIQKHINSTALWCPNCGPTDYGIGVQVAAPGTHILSLSSESNPDTAGTTPPRVLSGSSMAAPVVAGIAVTAMSVNVGLNASQVKDLIIANLGQELSFNRDDIPVLYVTKSLDLQQYRHRLVNMDAVIRAAAQQPGLVISSTPSSTNTVSVSVLCEYPEIDTSTGSKTLYKSLGKSLNARVGVVANSGIQWVQEGWAEPTLPIELQPGRFLLQLQGGAVGASWSSTETVYPIYFEVVAPLSPNVERLNVAFAATSQAACDSFANIPNPTVSATAGIVLPTAGLVDIQPAAITTDSISSWKFIDVAWWVKKVIWKIGGAVGDEFSKIQDGVISAAKMVLTLPGIRDVVAILTDGTSDQGVTLTTQVVVKQGATVSSIEPVGPVVAGQPAAFVLKGTSLPAGLVVTIQDCGVATELTQGGTETQRSFACTFPSSTAAGSKEVGVGPVGSAGMGSAFEHAVASGLAINVVRSTVNQVSAAPSPSPGSASVVSVVGANLPGTAVVLVDDATCDSGTISAKADGTGFTQSCTFGSAAGTKLVMVMSASGPSGYIIDSSKSLVVAAGSSPNDVTNGLVGRWTFDSCDARDSSGAGNNGTISGAPVCVPGKFGMAMRFNGTSDAIAVPNSASFPKNAITLSYWVHRDGISPASQLQNYISKELAFQSYLMTDGSFVGGLWLGGAGSWSEYGRGLSLIPALTEWVHFAFTFDNSTRIARTYIDGALKSEKLETNANSMVRASSSAMYIGRNGSANVYWISGLLDDVRMYDRALSPAEVAVLASGAGASAARIADTGVAACTDYAFSPFSLDHTNGLDCASTADARGDPIPKRQDGAVGRDAIASAGTLPKVGSGPAGFDFTKLDAGGRPLPASALDWACIKDNHMQLIWENKTRDGGLRDYRHRYTWYSSSINTNGGNAGDQGSDSCGGTLGTTCNTQSYVDAVNSVRLCGGTGWRLPAIEELRSIAHYGRTNPSIATDWFSDTVFTPAVPAGNWLGFWTTTLYSADPSASVMLLDFSLGMDFNAFKSNRHAVRAVMNAN